MTDSLPTIWDLEPHTAAKHRILRGYLNAWFPILAKMRKVERVLYIDGFAGPGSYKGGEPGSPIIALKAIEDATQPLPNPINIVFIEKDRERFAHLQRVLAPHKARLGPLKPHIKVKEIQEDCDKALSDVLDKYDRGKHAFGPALVFLDQFGYSDVPLSLIQRIMAHHSCEVLSYLNVDGILRFIGDPTKHGAMTKAFGGECWRPAMELPKSSQKLKFLALQYRDQLKAKAGVKYVWQFAMHGDGNKLLYWLFFCTNHDRGLEEMKRAMLKVDDSGGAFRFSDATPHEQVRMFDTYTNTHLIADIWSHFQNREVSVEEIRLHVLETTPRVNFKDALKALEIEGSVVANDSGSRRKGSFPDVKLRLKFGASRAEFRRRS